MKVSRQRVRAARPARRVISSYLIVLVILLAFFAGLVLLVALELLILG